VTRHADELLGAISLEELQDIVDRLGEELGEEPATDAPAPVHDSLGEAEAILAKARAMRAMLRGMGPTAPACFADRIVAAALDVDPVPDPTAIHRLPD